MTNAEHRQHQIGLLLVAAAAMCWSTSGLFVRAISEARPNPGKDEKLRLYAAHHVLLPSSAAARISPRLSLSCVSVSAA